MKFSHFMFVLDFVIVISFAEFDSPRKTEPPQVKIEAVSDIDGFYTFKSKATDGKYQIGIAVIKKINDAYVMNWNTTGGAIVGICARHGDSFSVGWAMESEKGVVRGISIYKIEAGPKLTGKYTTAPGNGRFLDETLTFLRPLPKDDE